MKDSEQNKSSNFNSKDEAFEYLVQQGQNQALKDFWKEEMDKMPEAKIKKINGGGGKAILFKIVTIAASFILIVSAYFLFNNARNDLPQMAAAMIQETNFLLESDGATRGLNEAGDNQDVITLQKNINAALEQKDYAQSAMLLQEKQAKIELSVSDKFYYALSLARMENGDLNKALQLTNEITQTKKKYYNEALWLQALMHLRLENREQAKSTLLKLQDQSNYQSKNTNRILEKIKD